MIISNLLFSAHTTSKEPPLDLGQWLVLPVYKLIKLIINNIVADINQKLMWFKSRITLKWLEPAVIWINCVFVRQDTCLIMFLSPLQGLCLIFQVKSNVLSSPVIWSQNLVMQAAAVFCIVTLSNLIIYNLVNRHARRTHTRFIMVILNNHTAYTD